MYITDSGFVLVLTAKLPTGFSYCFVPVITCAACSKKNKLVFKFALMVILINQLF